MKSFSLGVCRWCHLIRLLDEFGACCDCACSCHICGAISVCAHSLSAVDSTPTLPKGQTTLRRWFCE